MDSRRRQRIGSWLRWWVIAAFVIGAGCWLLLDRNGTATTRGISAVVSLIVALVGAWLLVLWLKAPSSPE